MSKIILNEGQADALIQMQKFIEGDSEDQHMFLFSGSAGCGKTTTISHLVQWVHDNDIAKKICMACPTHKALRVMREMCPISDKSEITFSTLHSMLGLKHDITKDGTEVFIRDTRTVTKFPFYDLVFIDESSMIPDQLFNEMVDQNYRKRKVIFIGDPNQINPVNHTMAIPMIDEKREEFNIGHVHLSKVVRQAEGNPIIKFSQKIINDTFTFENGYKEVADESGVVMVSQSQTKVLHQLINYYFKNEEFDKDANFCKMLAWRNVTVDQYNKLIRSIKYGNTAGKLVVGEKLIVKKPIAKDSKNVLFNTNDDLEVLSYEIKEKSLFDKTVWKYYDCKVAGSDLTENIHILHESDEIKYDKYVKTSAKAASSEKDSAKRLKKWREHYSFMDNFSQVGYNYCVTVHNSQGSTYDNCFVLNSDVCLNNNQEERRRIQYTAVTRPRKMLYIL
jgi:DNA polymerase III delta prime subunit